MPDDSASNVNESTPASHRSSGSGSSASALSQEQTVISKRRPSTPPTPLSTFRPTEIGAALEGEQLGHFLLEEFIGGGGMGAVFRGLDTMLGRIVAVKVVSNENTDDDTLRRFRNEAQSAARLDHPNIARVYYVGEDKGWNYIVFEFIEGVNVRDYVERQGLCTEAETISCGLQVASALAHAAAREVVHRDIKPSNILVMPDGRSKLVDMGLARLHQVDSPANDLTATGVTLGTFDYISPEQARDPRSADVRSDLYSLGCTLYFMLTGMPPFPEGTVLQKLLSHSSEPPPDPRELRPELRDDLTSVVLKLMAKLPEQRYQNPQELMADLAVLAERRGMPGIAGAAALVPSAAVSWQERAVTSLPWLVPALLLLAAGFVIERFWQPPMNDRALLARPRLELPGDLPSNDPGQDEPASASSDPPDEAAGSRQPPPEPTPTTTPSPGSDRSRESTADSERDPQRSAPPAPVDSSSVTPSSPVSPPRPPTVSETPPAEGPGPEGIPSTDSVAPRPSSNAAKRLVVGTSLDPEEVAVATLAEALERVADEPEIETIELRVRRLEVPTLTFDLRGPLTVRSANGYRPLLVYRSSAGEFIPERRMMKLLGDHDLRFEGIDFLMEVPYEIAPTFVMFHLNQIKSVTLTNCTLTIDNEFSGPTFFHVQGPRLSSTISGRDEMVEIAPPSIVLESAIVRGQATLVRAVEGLPFWLQWHQGLFASTERMLDVGGLSESSDAEVRVDLQHVTAAMELGFCRVRVDDMGPYLPAIDLRSHQSVFDQDPEWPLIEHVGVASREAAIERFRYGGEQNLYAATAIFWRVTTVDGQTLDVAWPERDDLWYEEVLAERLVRWANPDRPKLPVGKRTPAHYRVEQSQPGGPGFDETQLPPL